MTRNEAIQKLGGRKRATLALGGGCLTTLVLIAIVCSVLFGGANWIGGQVSAWSRSNEPVGYSYSDIACDDERRDVEPIYRNGDVAGYSCVLDIDVHYVGGAKK